MGENEFQNKEKENGIKDKIESEHACFKGDPSKLEDKKEEFAPENKLVHDEEKQTDFTSKKIDKIMKMNYLKKKIKRKQRKTTKNHS